MTVLKIFGLIGLVYFTFFMLVMVPHKTWYFLSSMFNQKNFIWLALVCIWNFGYPQATPIEDVMIAIILAGLSYKLNQTN